MKSLDEMFEEFWNSQPAHKAIEKQESPEQVAKLKKNIKLVWLSGYLTAFTEFTITITGKTDAKAEKHLSDRQAEIVSLMNREKCMVASPFGPMPFNPRNN